MTVAEKTAAEQAATPVRAIEGPVTTIRPPARLPRLDMRELWHFRELSWAFVLRDLKVRYKQTLIGVAWVLLQPLLATGIYTLIFGRYADFPSDNLPYQLFVFAGVLMWNSYFQPAFTGASGSIAAARALITKVYFPRVLLPVGTILTPLVDFLIVVPLLVGMAIYFNIVFTVHALLAPLFVLLATVTALGAGLVFTVAGVRYRDVPYALPFIVQTWFFCSPVIWSVNDLQTRYQWLASLNPMTGAITGFRWAVLGATQPTTPVLAVGTVSAVALLVTGLAFFRRAEPRFADTI